MYFPRIDEVAEPRGSIQRHWWSKWKERRLQTRCAGTVCRRHHLRSMPSRPWSSRAQETYGARRAVNEKNVLRPNKEPE